ncbi:DUF3604 domain-containing protein [Candidatus Binatia bacterium]|nr:DUF3604 domain-containing protein [Candidatus Binatia bacterium]
MRLVKRLLVLLLALVVLLGIAWAWIFSGGHLEGPGEVTKTQLPPEVVTARTSTQRQASSALGGIEGEPGDAKTILFGDLHVHTTFSADAFMRSLPLVQGEGAHPPADACDYARFCSSLDFWSINDHAESISPKHWRDTKEAIRQCNAVAGDPENPDVVAFLGWEWTQVGTTPENHYGHKNVIFKDTEEDRVPKRPISASGRSLALLQQGQPLRQRVGVVLADLPNRERYLDFGEYQTDLRATKLCEEGVDTRKLPDDCMETAGTPHELFEKLGQWGFDSLVIPHGTTWGLYTPPGTTFAKQLSRKENDPDRQRLFEIYSGHGNSEEYRDNQEVVRGPDGKLECAEPTAKFLPCCWQAGELIRARCGDIPADQCEQRVRDARANYVAAGVAGHLTVPGARAEEWKDCGQCRDCFLPAFASRPGNSAQFALAISNFDDPGERKRFRFGFIGSSDNHSARPGTGYKEYDRRQMTETTGARDETWARRLLGPEKPRTPESVAFDPNNVTVQPFQVVDFERQASFFMTGGLVAVHSDGRSRDGIWDALKRRETYGTSGERILLWFDLLNGDDGAVPMGGEAYLGKAPRFRVRAAGSFKQKPGCPDYAHGAMSKERLEKLCRGECYNPSDERHQITRIEVVRIRPQARPDEPIGPLIEDPWKRFDCVPSPDGCVVEFEDEDFVQGGRDATYYVRAVQEPTPAVNAGGLRCRYDEKGDCIEPDICYGDYRTPFSDDCLTPAEERAWSSPIYVNNVGAVASR